jgi:hypothetical protein
MRWNWFVPLLLVAGGTPSRPADPPKCDKHQHPFLVHPESVHAHVHTIALRRTFSPLPLGPEVEPRMLVFDSLLEATLQQHGYQLVSVRVTDSLWQRTMDSVGPMYDAQTGERDSTKWRAAVTSFRSALREGYTADAILYPSVRSASAEFSGQTAKWDGTKQSAVSFGSTVVDALLGQSYSGHLSALSLRVGLLAPDGEILYDNLGGIQVLATTSHGQFREVADSLILTDRGRMYGAIQIALCQFLSAKPPR